MTDTLGELTDLIRAGVPAGEGTELRARPYLEALFGSRYDMRHFDPAMVRDEFGEEGQDAGRGDPSAPVDAGAEAAMAGDGKPTGPKRTAGERGKRVPLAGLVNPANPPSGPYGGFSVVWFPTREKGSLLGFLVGSRGLSPDAAILTRPSHRWRVAELGRQLVRRGVDGCTKANPASLKAAVPIAVRRRLAGFEGALNEYGTHLYCAARVPRENARRPLARAVVAAFFDLYAHERGWAVKRKAWEDSTPGLDVLWVDLMLPVGWW